MTDWKLVIAIIALIAALGGWAVNYGRYQSLVEHVDVRVAAMDARLKETETIVDEFRGVRAERGVLLQQLDRAVEALQRDVRELQRQAGSHRPHHGGSP